jgi:hypothetical protein
VVWSATLLNGMSAAAQSFQPVTAKQAKVVLREGTDVKLQFDEGLSSKTATIDDTVNMVFAEDLKVGDVVAARSVAKAVATASDAKSADGGPALNATLLNTAGVLVDPGGNLYISEQHYVHRVVPDGTMTLVTGTLGVSYPGDSGPATNAPLTSPEGLAMDAAGNLYIVDNSDCRVRKLTVTDTSSAPAQVQ